MSGTSNLDGVAYPRYSRAFRSATSVGEVVSVVLSALSAKLFRALSIASKTLALKAVASVQREFPGSGGT
jgi:hypothetical protein